MECCHPKHNKKIERIEDKKLENKEFNKDINSHKKEKYINYFSSFTSFSGIFSSYQVCHSICLAVISLLS
ncbi:MAG: hypothetical protein AABX55_01540 [Nanoarchaeota archaeon]